MQALLKMASDQQPLHQPDSLPRAMGGGPAAEPPPRKNPCAGYHVYKISSLVYAILFVVSVSLIYKISSLDHSQSPHHRRIIY